MTSTYRQLWRLLEGERLRYLLAIACLALAILLGYLVPLVSGAALDFALTDRIPSDEDPALLRLVLELLGGQEFLKEHLWIAPVAMLALSALAGVFSYLKGWQVSLASDGIARRLKDRLYDHINHLPASHLDKSDTGDLVQRATSDVETTRQFLASQVTEIAQAAILAASALPLLLALDARMTLVSFALIGPLVAYGFIYFRKVRHVFRSVDEAEGALTGVVQENLTGIRVVRAFARQQHEIARFAGPNAEFRDRHLHLLRLMAWYWSVSDLVALSQIGLVLIVGAHAVAGGTLSVGVLFSFLAYLGIMLWPVRQMGRILTELGKTIVAVGRIDEILNVARESEPATEAPAQGLTGALRIRDLRFGHGGDRHALDGISLEVKPGETLAILGPSGAGKSTLMHLLLRLYDYTEGSIQLDGRELSSLPRKWVRSQIGVVLQEPFLFARTLRDNLLLGHGEAPDHEIEEAARSACIHDTITGFPEGYATVVGERGITLSGGQRQRVALARAVLRRPPILLLDDAMSAVDGETEAQIIDALRRRHGNATTIVIAHRLSTLVHADRVIVLDHGRVIQSGTHAELAAQPGLYRRLWEIQTSVEADLQRELQPN